MAKGTYSEVQSLDKKSIIKKIILVIIALVVVVIGLYIFRSIRNKPQEATKVETVTPSMVPSTIKYYDPSKEKTYDTGADYIVLTDGNQRVKVDSSGNVYKVSETGQITGTVTDEEKEAALKQAATIMQTDGQASLALAGLESRFPQEEEEAEPKKLTNEEALKALLEEKGINYNDFLDQVYGMGSTLNDVYTMLWMYEDSDKVIDAIMQSEKKTEETPKSGVSVTIEKLGTTESTTTNNTTTETSSSYEYPSWMQESDPTASMNALVETLSALSGGSGTSTTWDSVNKQAEKSSWLENQKNVDAGYSGKITKYDLVAGTVIPITLVTGINTDLPGDVIGLVRQDIYDTLTGTEILIPKGSRVMASYNSSVTFGQKSVQIAWTQLITPDGYVYTLPGFQGVTQEGYAGVSGKVNNHFWQILGGAVLGSIINYSTSAADSAISNAAGTIGNEYITSASDAIAGTTLDTVASFGTQYTSKWANMQPTITIKTGSQIQMLVNQTVSFKR